ncbi:MAG: aminotransferase class I/II-fold pyridoxal phosphate-dependent enzyme [Clostridia bacterium]|nr:aminotransferase class I/II-fold pyridoxal phosphate-dependent enzyme [Clostridia bacterium]
MYRIGKEEIEEVAKVIESKNLFKINDALHETEICEEMMRKQFNVKRSLLVTSGFAALTSALVGMGIGPGDEVIVPAYTYIATAMAVVAAGAIPVIADIDETYTIDPCKIEEKITPRTKAVIPVHIQGFPCDLDAIGKLADKYGFQILEDACQADGGSFHGRRLGTIGAAGALSFNQFKIISAGEGGALLTDDDRIYERALIYHDASAIAFFGNQLDGISEPQFCGSEFRTNEIAAAVLHRQLEKLDGILADLRKNKAYLTGLLKKKYKIGASNDLEGDCGTTLPVVFENEAEARAFAAKVGTGNYLPIDTGKHIYTHWTAILEQRGALHPLLDPFKFPVNAPFVPDYKSQVFPVTLDLLARTDFLLVSPDWTEEQMQKIAYTVL